MTQHEQERFDYSKKCPENYHGLSLPPLDLPRLDLSSYGITVEQIGEMARTRRWGELVELRLADNPLGSAEGDLFAHFVIPPKCRNLDLRGTNLTASDFIRFKDLPPTGSLVTLNLSRNELSDEGAFALSESAALQGLRELLISAHRLSAAGLAVLLGGVRLRELASLHLDNIPSTEAVYSLLEKAPVLTNLEVLSFGPSIVSGLNRGEREWWSGFHPTSNGERFMCTAMLLDRNKFPALRWVRAGDAIWSVTRSGFLQTEIPYEPGIDFL